MISEREFEHRLEQVRQNRELEPAFFRCLLDAVVYVHAPVSDDHPRLRLVQFRHPDGFDAIPFFTSLRRSKRRESPLGSLPRLSHCGGDSSWNSHRARPLC